MNNKILIFILILLVGVGGVFGCSGWRYLDNGSSVAYKYNPDGTINDTMYMDSPTPNNTNTTQKPNMYINMNKYETQ